MLYHNVYTCLGWLKINKVYIIVCPVLFGLIINTQRSYLGLAMSTQNFKFGFQPVHKVSKNVTLKRLPPEDEWLLGGKYLYIYCVMETGETFTSEARDFSTAFEEYCKSIQKLTIGNITITRLKTENKYPSTKTYGGFSLLYATPPPTVYWYKILESGVQFSSTDRDIYTSYMSFMEAREKPYNMCQYEPMDWE